MTDPGTAVQRLSASTAFELLEDAREVCSTTIARADIQAESHRGQRERRLIGVAVNYQPRQLRLDGRHLEHLFYDDVLFGIRARAHSGGLDLLLLTELPERVAGQPSHYVEVLRQHDADGVILVAFEPRDHEFEALGDANLPCIAIDVHAVGPRTSFVTSDNVGGAVAAVLQLGQLGRTQIAYIGGASGTVASSNRRLGYESALEELGLELREELVLETDWRPATACELAQRLLDSAQPPDAFFCASDELALGAMLAIEQAGRRIPDDVAVVGFDDAYVSRVVTPSLSSVRQDRIGLGATAVEALLCVLEEPGASLPVSVLPTELIVRKSSSPRPAPGHKAETEPAPSETSGERSETEPRLRLSITDALALLAFGNEPPVPGGGATSANEPRSVRARERRLLAVALGTTPDQSFPLGFFQGLFLAIRAQAHARGIDLLLLPSIEAVRDSPGETFVERNRRLGVEGLVILSRPRSERAVVEVAEAGFPCVTVGIDLLGDRVAFVRSDNVSGATQAVSHLAETGHRRIAFIGGNSSTRASVERRFGYQSELQRFGLEQRSEYTADSDWLPALARAEMERMLALPEPPDAVFCVSDVTAIGAMAAIDHAGFRIPDEVAVVGFDDIGYASLVTPALTTVRQDRQKMAAAAVDAMLRLLDRPGEPPAVSVLPVELVVRESSGTAVRSDRPTE
ncbi:MAG: substrate-binding domain-containing protein [Gaiellaceae bacterium]|jgi:LacI family transcriptional regulator